MSCSNQQIAGIKVFLENSFDQIINNDNRFKGKFNFNTDFCGSRRRLRLGGEEGDNDVYDDEMFVDGENNEASDWATTFAEESVERDLLQLSAASLHILQFFVGQGKCNFCFADNGDSRRLSGTTADDYFYQTTDDMEDALNSQLSTRLRNKFHWKSGHCLKGSDPSVQVHLLSGPDGNRSPSQACQRKFDYSCCAPKNDLSDACSKTVFGSTWFCHESKSNCQNTCNGAWVSANDPPQQCKSFWEECTHDKNSCCEPYVKCKKKNNHYWQCLP